MVAQVRKDGSVPWLRPDGKTQVTIEYRKEGGAMIPIRVHTILISTQHSPDVTNDKIHADLMEYVIKPVVPAKYMDDKTIFHLNPSGAACPLPDTLFLGIAPAIRLCLLPWQLACRDVVTLLSSTMCVMLGVLLRSAHPAVPAVRLVDAAAAQLSQASQYPVQPVGRSREGSGAEGLILGLL